MSSYYIVDESSFSKPDIGNINSPFFTELQEFDVQNLSEEDHNLSSLPHHNHVIPEYHPSAIPQHDTIATLQWSPPKADYYAGKSISDTGVQYYPNEDLDNNFQQVSWLESDNSSSVSSANGHNQQIQVPARMSASIFEENALKSKKRRGKVLNEFEAEIIKRDDSLLTEDELAIKRKAQNRLAQRAFRERKESKLKDLQSKLLESESERKRLLDALEEIKQQFISLKTDNQDLRSSFTGPNPVPETQQSKFSFPQSQEAFVEEMMTGQDHHINNATVNKIYEEPSKPGNKVLAVGAVWDYLSMKIEEEEYENIDMLEVMSILKGNEVCHGYGPAYPLKLVDAALHRAAEYHIQ